MSLYVSKVNIRVQWYNPYGLSSLSWVASRSGRSWRSGLSWGTVISIVSTKSGLSLQKVLVSPCECEIYLWCLVIKFTWGKEFMIMTIKKSLTKYHITVHCRWNDKELTADPGGPAAPASPWEPGNPLAPRSPWGPTGPGGPDGPCIKSIRPFNIWHTRQSKLLFKAVQFQQRNLSYGTIGQLMYKYMRPIALTCGYRTSKVVFLRWVLEILSLLGHHPDQAFQERQAHRNVRGVQSHRALPG